MHSACCVLFCDLHNGDRSARTEALLGRQGTKQASQYNAHLAWQYATHTSHSCLPDVPDPVFMAHVKIGSIPWGLQKNVLFLAVGSTVLSAEHVLGSRSSAHKLFVEVILSKCCFATSSTVTRCSVQTKFLQLPSL